MAVAMTMEVIATAVVPMAVIATRDFVKRRIAPLQERSVPVWKYSGRSDPMRLCADNLAENTLTVVGAVDPVACQTLHGLYFSKIYSHVLNCFQERGDGKMRQAV